MGSQKPTFVLPNYFSLHPKDNQCADVQNRAWVFHFLNHEQVTSQRRHRLASTFFHFFLCVWVIHMRLIVVSSKNYLSKFFLSIFRSLYRLDKTSLFYLIMFFSMTTEINFACQCLVEDYCNNQGYCNPNWLSRWFKPWALTVGFSSSASLFPKYIISLIPHRKSRMLTKVPRGVPKLGESEIEWGKVNNTFTI